MTRFLLKLIGWKAFVLSGDPALYIRYKWLKKHLQPGPLRTLDAGSGNGCMSMLSASIGNRTLGISFHQDEVDKANARVKSIGLRNVEYRNLNLTTLNGDLGRFDQIICLETIEHIIDGKGLVKNFSALLNPGGRLILCTPYLYHRPYYQEWMMQTSEEDGGHVRFGYSEDELKALLKEADLEPLTVEYSVGFVTVMLANLFIFLNHFHPRLGWIATFPLRPLQAFDSALTKLFHYPYLSIGIVGIKK